jgi:hypothetical protein
VCSVVFGCDTTYEESVETLRQGGSYFDEGVARRCGSWRRSSRRGRVQCETANLDHSRGGAIALALIFYFFAPLTNLVW